MKTILVYRFSAMGDVALVAPVIKSVLHEHQNTRLIFVTRSFFLSFFDDNERLVKVGVDLKQYKGALGIRKLFLELKKEYKPELVVDLHDVLRTQILNTFFKSSGIPVYKIDKGRKEKKEMIASKDVEKPLKTSIERYLETFGKAGFPTELIQGPWISPQEGITDFLGFHHLLIKENKWVGVAPFAKHETKIWGLSKIEDLIVFLLEAEYKVFLFGGGEDEFLKLNYLVEKYQVINASKELSFKQEMSLMQQLDVMITMDSSNMHIASLLGVDVVSIWGSTHPNLGFPPIRNENNIIMTSEHLSCQPCSVFGNKPCSRGDHACMKLIEPIYVYKKIQEILRVIV